MVFVIIKCINLKDREDIWVISVWDWIFLINFKGFCNVGLRWILKIGEFIWIVILGF